MPLLTTVTQLFSITHPIVLAPMGGASGGALAAAVSNGGGLGLVEAWRGREAELDGDEAAKAAYQAALERGDLAAVPVWASESIDLITEVTPAADLVGAIAADAEAALARAGRL